MPHSLAQTTADSTSYLYSQLATLDQEEQEKIAPIQDSLAAAYEKYDTLLGDPTRLLKLPVSETQALSLNRLYDRLDRKETDPSDLRGLLLLTLVCPYCDFGDCRQIDHFLPKKAWPEFSVHTTNLVPCCADCNQLKAQRHLGAFGTKYLHPYFDTHPRERHLYVSAVISGINIQYIYNLDFADSTPEDIRHKISHLYSDLELLHRFGRRAATKMSALKITLLQQYRRGGKRAVRSYLRLMERSAVNPGGVNNWETVLFNCLASDDEFCTLQHWRRQPSMMIVPKGQSKH